MVLNLLRSTRFLWNATRGSRLRPWRSEYLRWRMETYTGKTAGTLRFQDFLDLMMNEHRQFLRFLVWTSEIQSLAHGPETGSRK